LHVFIKRNHILYLWKMTLENTCHIFAIIIVKIVFFFFPSSQILFMFDLMLECWIFKPDATFSLFLHFSFGRIIWESSFARVAMCWWRVSADELRVLIKLFPLRQKHSSFWDCWIFGLCTSPGILKNTKEHNVSEIGYVSVLRSLDGRQLLCWVLYKDRWRL
jgi:hypothetical protein